MASIGGIRCQPNMKGGVTMALSIQEQETVIVISEDTKQAKIYCSAPRWMKKLDKIAERSRVHKQKRSIVAAEYEVPENFIKVAKPRKLNLTDEQKAKLVSNLKKGKK